MNVNDIRSLRIQDRSLIVQLCFRKESITLAKMNSSFPIETEALINKMLAYRFPKLSTEANKRLSTMHTYLSIQFKLIFLYSLKVDNRLFRITSFLSL